MKKGEGTSTPLENEPIRSNKKPLAQIEEWTSLEKVVASAVMSILTLVFIDETNYVKLASILSFLLAPMSYYRQVCIMDIKALKETIDIAK